MRQPARSRIDRAGARHALTGAIASIRPAFLRDGELDPAATQRSVEAVIGAGSRTLLVTYGDSLHSVLTDRELGDLLRLVIDAGAGRAMVVAADRAWATPVEVAFAREARERGADVLMVLPPTWGGSVTEDSLVDHYRAVAAELPVMVVTAPFAPDLAMGTRVVERLIADEPGFVGIKDDVIGDWGVDLARIANPHVAFLAGGQKVNHLILRTGGSEGSLSTFIHINPAITHAYWAAIEAGDLTGAEWIVERYDRPFFERVIGVVGGFDAGIRAAIEIAGGAPRWRPDPYVDLDAAAVTDLADFLRDACMLDATVEPPPAGWSPPVRPAPTAP